MISFLSHSRNILYTTQVANLCVLKHILFIFKLVLSGLVTREEEMMF